jgi:hypothetical protein
MDKRHKISLTLKVGFFVFASIGILAAESPRSLYYYTLQSNLWMIIVQTIFLIDEIRVIKHRNSYIKPWHRLLKFVSVIAVTLTMLVFGIILAPVLPLDVTFSVTSVMLHFIAPSFALVDLFLFENDIKVKNSELAYAYVPALFYFLFVMTFIALGIKFPPEQSLVPYFFMDYETLGWFTISSNGIGVVYWMIILLVLLTGIAVGLRSMLAVFKTIKPHKTQ